MIEWYEKFITRLQEELEKEQFGSQNYYKIMDIMERVQTMKLKEEHEVNASVEEYNRTVESERKAEAERKSEKRKALMDILRIAIPVGGSLLMLVLVMIFEQGGKIVPQRFVSWIIKPKI